MKNLYLPNIRNQIIISFHDFSGISGNDFALVIRAQLDSAVYTENDKIMIRLNISKRRQRYRKINKSGMMYVFLKIEHLFSNTLK